MVGLKDRLPGYVTVQDHLEAQEAYDALRDQFATAALQGILAGPCSREDEEWFEVPEMAYRLAEAMLAERKKRYG